MLVITRKENQRVRIGKDIEVVVVAIQGNRVRLGFKAPQGIQILRDDAENTQPKISEPGTDGPSKTQAAA